MHTTAVVIVIDLLLKIDTSIGIHQRLTSFDVLNRTLTAKLRLYDVGER